VRLTSRVTQIRTHHDLPYYKVPFPVDVDFPQRRLEYRVPVPMNTGLPVSVLMPDERILAGTLRDVSPEGFGMRVRTGLPDIERDKGSPAICEIRLPRGVEFVADMEVCHIDLPTRGRAPRVGARFVRLSGAQSRRLEQFCAALAREQRKLR
jgi:c-di-GMP-binding flagellar brake protein YcgR